MTSVVEEGILLTFDELRILLFSCGLRETDGIYMPEKQLSEQEAVNVLLRMEEAGLIRAAEREFEIREDLRRILRVMTKPERSFPWTPSGGNGRAFYCYLAEDGAVVSERYRRKKDTLKLRFFSAEDFEKWKEETACDDR